MGYLGLLLAVLITGFLAATSFKSFFKISENQVGNRVSEVSPEHKINTSNYQSTIKDIHSQLDQAAQKELDRVKEIEELK